MRIGQYRLEFGYILSRYGWHLLDGAFTTLWISVIILSLSLAIGLVAGLGRVSRNRFIYMISSIYVELMRNIPELVILFFFYFGLPEIGVRLNQYIVGIIALSLHTGGYIAEIFRAGIRSVATQQYWSALALGLSRRQVLWKIIIPQIRADVLPAIVNQFVYTVKDTPMLAFIFIKELMYEAYDIQTNTWKVIEIYIIVGLIYEFFSLMLGLVGKRTERHFKKYRKTGSS